MTLPEEIQETQNLQGQAQDQPGLEHEMSPAPVFDKILNEYKMQFEDYWAVGKLKHKSAIITGGDSGIGRAVAVLFAKEGVDRILLVYTEKEQKDAEETKKLLGDTKVILMPIDIGSPDPCKEIAETAAKEFGHIDLLVNNAGEQHVCENIEDIDPQMVERTFRTNIMAMIWLSKYCVPHMPRGSKIINCASVTAYKGMPVLLDYSATKGAIVSFTRSLALQVASKGIRVNAVAPGPIWTPLIPASFGEEGTKKFGKHSVPLGRVGHPVECATCFVFLASGESSFMTGQVLHCNGGSVVNG
jgi:NAD(P)-dependent dehydrogenase (short-subunit alcohol dehydrogenase family)